MISRIVFLDRQLVSLRRHLFDRPGIEGAAFVLCGESRSAGALKLVCHTVQPIAEEDFVRREALGLTITSRALTRIAKLARYENLSVIFAHSHPDGVPHFSEQDDKEERELLPFLQSRVPERIHGTVVLTQTEIAGRIYAPDRISVGLILSIGERIKMWTGERGSQSPEVFDRQVRAFGKDTQNLLSMLHVGVVGAGGTGSPLIEQLTRLGVGEISVFDGDQLDVTNVNRVYGSAVNVAGESKAEISRRHVERIGLNTKLNSLPQHITEENTAKHLRDCDIVFGCTDRQLPRAILIQLSLRYSIPVFDLGVLIDADRGRLLGAHARVTTVMAGEACLFCRGRISPEVIRIEALSGEDRMRQHAEGYAPALDDPAPAVIAFTSAIASFAVAELLHRVTGFRGGNRNSSETLISFDENRIHTSRVEPRTACVCTDESSWGRGDEQPYLGLVWPSHTS